MTGLGRGLIEGDMSLSG